jgi:broad specificity phosphatase PhoE
LNTLWPEIAWFRDGLRVGTVIAVQKCESNGTETEPTGVRMNENIEKLVSLTIDMIKASGGKAPNIAYMSETAHQNAYLKANFPAEWIFARSKLREGRRSGKVIGRFFIHDIGNMIRAGKRVTLLMRHAERPPLDPSDTTFGETLPITERGRLDAESLGSQLTEIVDPDAVLLYASQTFRTIQTACAINTRLGCSASVEVKGVLGGETPFFGSLDERMHLIAEGRYMERLNDYYRIGTQLGYRPLIPATDAIEDALESLHSLSSSLVIAVTHDINVASFLAGRGVMLRFDEVTWPHYLDAAVIVNDDNGGVEYGEFRWNR